MRVLVLCGGPDREREVSLLSGANVARALREAGHEVVEADAGPGDLAAIEAFAGDAVFPVMHGRWGEGGPLQAALEGRGLAYVGCGPTAAQRCMDKIETKRRLDAAGVPTPAWAVAGPDDPTPMEPPVVVKAPEEGSSFAMAICPEAASLRRARAELAHYDRLLVERFIEGRELTVGVLAANVLNPDSAPPAPPAAPAPPGSAEPPRSRGDAAELGVDPPAEGKPRADRDPRADDDPRALPVLEIRPAEGFYDFEAKYRREDTAYRFDIDLPTEALRRIESMAVRAFVELGCRDLSRVDVMVDAEGRPWVLEINTMPGFTDHSLLPMAAGAAGLSMPVLCDRLVRRAAARRGGGV